MKKFSKKSFTLVEILVVIGILGILVSISIPIMRNFQPGLQLRNSTQEIISDLRYAQQLTITQQREYCVRFFPAEKKYQIIQCEATQFLKEKVLPQEIKTLSISVFTNNEIRYNPYGAVREEGTITLENYKGETKIILFRRSGFIKISD